MIHGQQNIKCSNDTRIMQSKMHPISLTLLLFSSSVLDPLTYFKLKIKFQYMNFTQNFNQVSELGGGGGGWILKKNFI
jgi:hypothetical protein